MAKFYYGTVLLPEIPTVEGHPYVFMRKRPETGVYQAIFTDERVFYTAPGMQGFVHNTAYSYVYCRYDAQADSWVVSDPTTGWFASAGLFWSNTDLPNGSASASDIYLRATDPKPEGSIILMGQGQSTSSNSDYICSLTMPNCTVGNTMVLAYAVRGDDNNPGLPSGWTRLGGGNNVDTIDGINQRLFFATKEVTAQVETVILTQPVTRRSYMVCAEYANVSSVEMRNDLAVIGQANYTVVGTKSDPSDVMMYGVTSAYYSSGRKQTASPNDLVKIQGDESAERLACWFDDGTGAMEHTFVTLPGFTEPRSAVLECVQLFKTGDKPVGPTRRIFGSTVGVSKPRSDWNQSDDKKSDYIKNKPSGSLPVVTAEDNGKFLRVVDGAWGVASLQRAEEVKF